MGLVALAMAGCEPSNSAGITTFDKAIAVVGEPPVELAAAPDAKVDAPPKKDANANNEQAAAPQLEHPFPRRGPAPALDGGIEWINAAGPIDLKDLRGKFVLLDFWTYCCINCMHVLPELKKLEQKYPNNVVVIGVHSAKFDTEQDSDSIRQAVMRYEIEHPVVNDANHKIWDRYFCQSWPSMSIARRTAGAFRLGASQSRANAAALSRKDSGRRERGPTVHRR
jgi:thiol-disulfide isomerase/thioredoxin